MSENLQFDSSLGGDQQVPNALHLLTFTAARAVEIENIRNTLQATTGTKLAFQRLPKHMRRRVMSHNVKRLPRRLRDVHLHQIKKSGMPTKPKGPSRKHRRRHHSLIQEYIRRQGTCKWLETHIWHAKRFHMTQKWGYRLGLQPCDKAFRACYRATAKHCLVQDMSYYKCIELKGPIEVLINQLRSLSDPNIGLSVGAKSYIHGRREGKTVFFKKNGSRRKAIGTIYFHWRPVEASAKRHFRVIWLWVHAAYYKEVFDILLSTFDLTIYKESKVIMYVNKTTNIKLIELKNQLSRFRLTGPLSMAILNKALIPVTLETIQSKWFKEYFSSDNNPSIFLTECELWKCLESVSSPAELPPHFILTLTVEDPRVNMPKTRTKATLQWNTAPNNIQLTENIAAGAIWQGNIRNYVRENKIPNTKFNEMRSELLVPGTEMVEVEEAVPIMLIQRPGCRSENLGYGSGWDLIVPTGWGNSFWLSLIMWGGRAGGLREFNSLQLESGQLPFLTPDTQAGLEEDNNITEKYRNRFFKLPPNKRPNYFKLGIAQPFSSDWKTLIHNWKPNSVTVKDFCVLRDKSLLLTIQELFTSKSKKVNRLNYTLNCIVPVRLKLKQKGTIKPFATICLPTFNDINLKIEPVEPFKKDKNQSLRKELRKSHMGLLKRLRRQRIRSKRKGKIIPSDVKMLQEYQEKMRKLWLPEGSENIRKSCSREIIGFVTSGSFSYTQARSCAVGYVAMGAIKALNSNPTVLLRNTTSRQYRTGSLEIIV